jgi:CheY-like chemotaxis protein
VAVDNAPRILVAAALGRVIEPAIRAAFSDATVVLAASGSAIRRAVQSRVRFDVVLTDLMWNDASVEFEFDGLDVIAILRDVDRTAPIVIAAQGHGVERDHLDEAVVQPEVVGIYQKSTGPGPLVHALQLACTGQRLPGGVSPRGTPTIYSYFGSGRRGATAARLAGAIAAGRASDSRTLAAAARIPLNTVNKLTYYLGPLIEKRHEHDPHLPLTSQVVYRWCGEHAHYILSWCRRNGHAEVARRAPRTG